MIFLFAFNTQKQQKLYFPRTKEKANISVQSPVPILFWYRPIFDDFLSVLHTCFFFDIAKFWTIFSTFNIHETQKPSAFLAREKRPTFFFRDRSPLLYWYRPILDDFLTFTYMHLKKLVFLVRERRPNIFCLERFAASQGNKNNLSVGADQLKKETDNEPKRKNQEREN